MSIRQYLLNGALGFGGAPLRDMYRNIPDAEAEGTVAALFRLLGSDSVCNVKIDDDALESMGYADSALKFDRLSNLERPTFVAMTFRLLLRRTSRVVGIFEAMTSIILIPASNRAGSLSPKVASGKVSCFPGLSATEITGMKEPDARIKQVNRSLSLSGIEWHREMRSKPPTSNRLIASFTDRADTTM